MIHSMTGYGRSRMTVGEKEITVEIKSVNSRFFDCPVRISRAYSHLEERIKPFLLEKGVSRGKVDVGITVEPLHAAAVRPVPDREAIREYVDTLRALGEEFGLTDDLSVTDIAKNPDLFVIPREEDDPERDWEEVRTVLDAAADAFLAARAKEGAALEQNLREKLAFLRGAVEKIDALSAAAVPAFRERFEARMRELLADVSVVPDETRVLTECAIYADKVAVDEELVRLRTHFDAMEEILSGNGEAVGRRLDFLVQEMNREVNTTGSKCCDAAITALVVDAKCELEKIREQIQNLE